MGSCGQEGLVDGPFIKEPVVRSAAPSVCMLKCSWLTLNSVSLCCVFSISEQRHEQTLHEVVMITHHQPPQHLLYFSLLSQLFENTQSPRQHFMLFTKAWLSLYYSHPLPSPYLVFQCAHPWAFKCFSSAFSLHLCLACCCFCFPTLRQQHFRSNTGHNRPAVAPVVQFDLCGAHTHTATTHRSSSPCSLSF